MSRLLDEIMVDLNFIKGHTLQPRWFKVLKVFVLLGVVLGYYRLFGLAKTVAFFAIFFALMLLVHMVYRVKTHTWTETWLDFVVVEENGVARPTRVGRYYYAAGILGAILSFAISQTLF